MSTKSFNSSNIQFIGNYYPYRIYNEEGNLILNPKFDNFGGKILDLKSDDVDRIAEGVHFFYPKLKKWINPKIVAVTIPSHDPAKTESGICSLVKLLCEDENYWIDGTATLRRMRKIDKLSRGGSRNIIIHKESILVNNPELIFNKNVILIDDVTTSGNSMKACREILLEAHAKSVDCLALGKTTWE